MGKKKLAASALCGLLGFGATAHATCYGSGSVQTCYDSSGNSYMVQRIGSQTYVHGSNPQAGSRWSQTSTTYGNTTYTNGYDKDGNHWDQTSTRLGNTISTYGRDSDGDPYSYYGTIDNDE